MLARTALLACALALLLAGCGDDDTTTVTTTETAATSGSTTSSITEDTTTSTTSTEGDVPATESLGAFTSPSGNIGCAMDEESVRCDIRQRSWKPPPAPKDCELDYGQGLQLSAGAEPGFVCAGDTTLGAGPPLPYGEATAKGLLTCESEESGMTCTDTETGRGFTLSKESYELF